MAGELLLEIGTEEIPSDYFEGALNALGRLAETYLKENRIEMGAGLEIYATPRRLVLIGKALGDKQEDVSQEITGPPKKAAYDGQGNPTKAALGFADESGIRWEGESHKGCSRFCGQTGCLGGRSSIIRDPKRHSI
jgi:glycyl-tRNA synthetase beta chain